MKAKLKVVSIMAVALCAISFCAPSANAEIVTIEIEAEIDSVSDPYNLFGGNIKVGDIIKGSYTYDTSIPDSNPLSQVADYEHRTSSSGISLTVGDFEFRTDPTNVNFLVEVVNNNAGIDGYLLTSYNNLPLPNSTPVNSISWTLIDYTKSAFSSTDLLTTAPVLDDWGFNRLSFGGGTRASGYVLLGRVTSAEVVPEPAAILLLALGGLVLRKRR